MAPATPGYWGEPTSTLDWCEINYNATYYIAEFWNTISNLVMIVFPMYGAYLGYRDRLELRFIMCHILLLVIGIGSWCFHMTLLYEMQLLDELPMVWGSCVLIYCLVSILWKPGQDRTAIEWSLFAYTAVVTVVYVICKNPIFHEVAYGIMVGVMFLMDLAIARTKRCNVALFVVGANMYMFGFILWNIDNYFCSRLTNLRSTLPAAIGPVTQLHAWWHVFAGYATYIHIVFCTHARALQLRKNFEVEVGRFGLVLKKQTNQKRKL